MRDRSDAEVLAPLERQLRDDPVVLELAVRLARSGCRSGSPTGARADRRAVLLAAGLLLMLLGCVVLSPATAVVGAAASVAVLAATGPSTS